MDVHSVVLKTKLNIYIFIFAKHKQGENDIKITTHDSREHGWI